MATKKVRYQDGPDYTEFAGVLFQRGVPQEIDAGIADELIRKGRLEECQPDKKPAGKAAFTTAESREE